MNISEISLFKKLYVKYLGAKFLINQSNNKKYRIKY